MRLLLAAGLTLSLAATARAEDAWSRFRGPNGTGYVRDIQFPALWTDAEYDWKVALPGKGHSSPVAWGDRVFVTSGDEATAEMIVLALHARTGATLWSRRFASQPHTLHGSNSYASSTPAADAVGVYVAWASPASLRIASLTHAGDLRWERDLGPVDYNHGFGGSPIVAGDQVVLASDNEGESFVVALNARSGQQRWRASRTPGTASYATPAVVAAADGSQQVVVHSTAEGMTALLLDDGAVAWRAADVFPVRCVASPLVTGALVVGSSGEGGNGKSFVAVRPPTANHPEPRVAYKLAKSLPQVPTPVAADKLLFVWSDRGVVTCSDLATGNVRWSERVGGNYFGSPVIAGDRLYCIAADGQMIALAAADRYQFLGRTPLGEASHATPAIHQGRMYLRTERSLACLPALAEAAPR